MAFNPFNKAINEPLNESDLAELINQKIAEGYYIEYKGAIFPSGSKISHSIASLANSYGGWYFIGIETDAVNVANNIVGFDLNTYRDPIAKVREIVKEHVDPIPRFYIQQVNLAQSDKAVLVVYIPPEQDTPFITKDGRIYRRTHDSSDPIPESNRYTIDRLIEEGRKSRELFAKFCNDERTFSKGEAENSYMGWLNIFIKPYSYEPITRLDWEVEQLRTLLQQSKESFDVSLPIEGIHLSANLPFTNIYPTQKSIVLKQIKPHYSIYQGLTVEFFFDGRAKFHIPINFFDLDARNLDEWQLTSNGITSSSAIEFFREVFEEIENPIDFQFLRFFNVGQLAIVVITLSTFYLNWLKYDDGLITDLKLAVQAVDVWRAIPFIDDEEWVTHIREFGFPTGKTSVVTFPENIGKGHKTEASAKHKLGQVLADIIGLMFGFPTEIQALALGHYMQKVYDAQQNQREG